MNRLNDDELEMKLRELFESNYEYLKENSLIIFSSASSVLFRHIHTGIS